MITAVTAAATVLVAASATSVTSVKVPRAPKTPLSTTSSGRARTAVRTASQPDQPGAPSAGTERLPFFAPLPAEADAPPPDPDPAAPGQIVEGGADQSDPFLFRDGTYYFLYTSGIPGPPSVNVPVTSATGFGAWAPVTDALPVLPPWVGAGFTWAPDVHQFGTGFVLYFTALVRNSHPAMECIGEAVGSSPTGPFRPFPQPFICQPTLGGDIDPRVFVAPDGANYMLWKSDQNIGGANTPTQMWSAPLSTDGLTLTGPPALLLMPDEPWEGTVVEAPDMVAVGNTFWLVFSGNWYNGSAYAIGAARCVGPRGPCADLPQNPLLASNAQGAGPGESSLFADSDGVWMLYSPWHSLAPHPDIPPRPVVITRLGFDTTGPYLAGAEPPPPLDLLGPWMGRAPGGRSVP